MGRTLPSNRLNIDCIMSVIKFYSRRKLALDTSYCRVQATHSNSILGILKSIIVLVLKWILYECRKVKYIPCIVSHTPYLAWFYLSLQNVNCQIFEFKYLFKRLSFLAQNIFVVACFSTEHCIFVITACGFAVEPLYSGPLRPVNSWPKCRGVPVWNRGVPILWKLKWRIRHCVLMSWKC